MMNPTSDGMEQCSPISIGNKNGLDTGENAEIETNKGGFRTQNGRDQVSQRSRNEIQPNDIMELKSADELDHAKQRNAASETPNNRREMSNGTLQDETPPHLNTETSGHGNVGVAGKATNEISDSRNDCQAEKEVGGANDDKKGSMSSLQLSSRIEQAQTFTWIRNNYEEDKETCLAKTDVYKDYEAYCESHDIRVLGLADFGKVFKCVFPAVTSRRLGPRGQSIYYYNGIVKKANAQQNSHTGSSSSKVKRDDITPEDLENASKMVVCEWAQKLLGLPFSSLRELAEFLVSNLYVNSRSAAAFTMIEAMNTIQKDGTGTVISPNINKHRETQLQLQKTLQMRQLKKIQAAAEQQKNAAPTEKHGTSETAEAEAKQSEKVSASQVKSRESRENETTGGNNSKKTATKQNEKGKKTKNNERSIKQAEKSVAVTKESSQAFPRTDDGASKNTQDTASQNTNKVLSKREILNRRANQPLKQILMPNSTSSVTSAFAPVTSVSCNTNTTQSSIPNAVTSGGESEALGTATFPPSSTHPVVVSASNVAADPSMVSLAKSVQQEAICNQSKLKVTTKARAFTSSKTVSDLLKEQRGYGPVTSSDKTSDPRPVAALLKEKRPRLAGNQIQTSAPLIQSQNLANKVNNTARKRQLDDNLAYVAKKLRAGRGSTTGQNTSDLLKNNNTEHDNFLDVELESISSQNSGVAYQGSWLDPRPSSDTNLVNVNSEPNTLSYPGSQSQPQSRATSVEFKEPPKTPLGKFRPVRSPTRDFQGQSPAVSPIPSTQVSNAAETYDLNSQLVRPQPAKHNLPHVVGMYRNVHSGVPGLDLNAPLMSPPVGRPTRVRRRSGNTQTGPAGNKFLPINQQQAGGRFAGMSGMSRSAPHSPMTSPPPVRRITFQDRNNSNDTHMTLRLQQALANTQLGFQNMGSVNSNTSTTSTYQQTSLPCSPIPDQNMYSNWNADGSQYNNQSTSSVPAQYSNVQMRPVSQSPMLWDTNSSHTSHNPSPVMRQTMESPYHINQSPYTSQPNSARSSPAVMGHTTVDVDVNNPDINQGMLEMVSDSGSVSENTDYAMQNETENLVIDDDTLNAIQVVAEKAVTDENMQMGDLGELSDKTPPNYFLALVQKCASQSQSQISPNRSRHHSFPSSRFGIARENQNQPPLNSTITSQNNQFLTPSAQTRAVHRHRHASDSNQRLLQQMRPLMNQQVQSEALYEQSPFSPEMQSIIEEQGSVSNPSLYRSQSVPVPNMYDVNMGNFQTNGAQYQAQQNQNIIPANSSNTSTISNLIMDKMQSQYAENDRGLQLPINIVNFQARRNLTGMLEANQGMMGELVQSPGDEPGNFNQGLPLNDNSNDQFSDVSSEINYNQDQMAVQGWEGQTSDPLVPTPPDSQATSPNFSEEMLAYNGQAGINANFNTQKVDITGTDNQTGIAYDQATGEPIQMTNFQNVYPNSGQAVRY